MGTSTTCSATTCKELRRKLSTSTGRSTICSTGTSRAWTSSKPTPQCCPKRPCGSGSCSTPGRVPRGGVVCPRGAWCCACSASSLALTFSGRCAQWCKLSVRAIATVIRSCFSHALPPPPRGAVACSQRLPASHFHV